jgi:hypothetical protein
LNVLSAKVGSAKATESAGNGWEKTTAVCRTESY